MITTSTEEKAAQFLMQATLGADYTTIQAVSRDGIENWLNSQLNYPFNAQAEQDLNNPVLEDRFYTKTRDLWRGRNGQAGFKQAMKAAFGEDAINGSGNNPALPYKYYFRMAWWHRTLAKGLKAADTAKSTNTINTQADTLTGTTRLAVHETDSNHLVRQRVAQALSEIVVISDNSVLELNSEGMASFYDILYRHALGSYKDLLLEVSLHPCMGVYLSHMNNRKGVPNQNIHPDENYAREIMQLFTIGLFQLNPDGTRKKDAQGKDIPTYTNSDIKELARVFTGLKADHYRYEWPNARVGDDSTILFSAIEGKEIQLDDGQSKTFKTIPYVDMTKQMKLDNSFHDNGSKSLLNRHISLSAGATAAQDIEKAVERLVAHPNTAPFIATKLIQQLVTSNPLPAYVKAVASKFGANGNLKAVIKEILTYPLTNPVTKRTSALETTGSEKLKSPLLRATQLLRGFNAYNASGRMWVIGDGIKSDINQHPLSSPTVFNFYKPDFTPHGKIEAADKVAPEFELHNAYTSISYVNMIYQWLFGDALPLVSTTISQTDPTIKNVPELNADTLLARSQDKLKFEFSEELKLAARRDRHYQLIERVSLILAGKKTLSIKEDIYQTLTKYNTTTQDSRLWIVQTTVFMVAVSAEFAVLGK